MAEAWELISTSNPSAASSVDFTDLSSYKFLRVTWELEVSGTNPDLEMRTSTDNGSSYDNGGTDYFSVLTEQVGGGVTNYSVFSDSIQIAEVNDTCSGTIIMANFNQAEQLNAIGWAQTDVSGNVRMHFGIFRRLESVARDAFQIFPSTGTMTGQIILEGRA